PALRGRHKDLTDALGWSAPLSANLADLMRQLDRQRTEVQRGIDSSGAVLESLGRREGVLRAAITQGNRFFAVSAQRDRDVTAMFHAFPAFLRGLTATANTAEAASGDLTRAATSLEPVAPLMAPAFKQTKTLAPALAALFSVLPATEAAGVKRLP